MRNGIMLGVVALATAGLLGACGTSTSPQTATFTSTMNGANEAPAVTTTATGTATYTLNGRTITYTVNVTGLSGPATASHIHIGAAGVPGAVIFPFTTAAVQTGQVASGTINLDQQIVNGTSSMTGDSLLVLFNNGHAYTNVHTAAHGAGEIRGQIVRQ